MTLYLIMGIGSVVVAIAFFEAGVSFTKRRLNSEMNMLEKEIHFENDGEKIIRKKLIEENIALKQNFNQLKKKSDAYQEATQQHLSELKKQLTHAKSILNGYKGRLKNLIAKVTLANSEKAQLMERLEIAEKDLQEIPALEKKNNELAQALDLLNAKLKDFDLIQNKNKKNRGREVISSAAETLRAGAAFNNESLMQRKGLGGAFQSMVNRMSQMDGSLGVVVADELGLLVAGTGEHMETLAGMAAVYSDIDRNVTALIPFGEIDFIRIRGLENLNLTIQPFKLESEKLVLTAFTSGKMPDRSFFDQFTRQLITA